MNQIHNDQLDDVAGGRIGPVILPIITPPILIEPGMPIDPIKPIWTTDPIYCPSPVDR